MLPGMDGVQLVQTLRFKKIYAPVLMLSALNAVQDKVSALDCGADDYITKPFHFDELLSRIKALTRRLHYQQKEMPSAVLSVGTLTIDQNQYKVRSEEHTSELQSRPHLVCRLLLEKKKKKK